MESSRLVGRWKRVQGEGQADDDHAILEFTPTGDLTYAIELPDGAQVIKLKYEVVGDEIVTDQPSRPRLERSRFYFENVDTLVVEFDGLRTWFRRDFGGGAA